jgi:hypothetical protein
LYVVAPLFVGVPVNEFRPSKLGSRVMGPNRLSLAGNATHLPSSFAAVDLSSHSRQNAVFARM